jgi:hypothetical protein
MQMKASVAPSDQIFEVTKDPVTNWEKYPVIVSHTISFVTFN